MSVDKSEIEKIAKLARLSYENTYHNDMNKIIHMFNAIKDAQILDVEIMVSPINVSTPLRDDLVVKHNTKKELLSSVSIQNDQGCYIVPKMIDN